MHAPAWLQFCILQVIVPLFVCGVDSLLWRPFSDTGTEEDAICCVEEEWEGHGFADWGQVLADQVH